MAFDAYYSMGQHRSLKALATKMGRGVSTLEKWSSEGRWTSRIAERERVTEEFNKSISESEHEAERFSKYRRLADNAIVTWFKDLQDGKIKLKGEDLKMLVEVRARFEAQADRQPLQVHHTHEHHGAIDMNFRDMSKEQLANSMAQMLRSMERLAERPRLGEAKRPTASDVIDAELLGDQKPVESPDFDDLVEDDFL